MSITHDMHFTATRRPTMRSPIALLADVFAVWQQRRVLARLDDSRLCDLGISRADALREATRPVWDVPTGWRG